MKLLSFIFVIWKLVLIFHLVNSLHDGRETATDYFNQWIVRIEGDFQSANSVAEDLGYTNLGEVIICGYLAWCFTRENICKIKWHI